MVRQRDQGTPVVGDGRKEDAARHVLAHATRLLQQGVVAIGKIPGEEEDTHTADDMHESRDKHGPAPREEGLSGL